MMLRNSRLLRRVVASCAGVAFSLVGWTVNAQVQLSPVLGEGAILQRGKPIPLWGRAPANAMVSVSLGKEKHQIRADGDGHWRVVLGKRAVGGPLTLSVSAGKYHTRRERLLMGDVWVCSGQSNMEMELRRTAHAQREISSANNPEIRLFKVPLHGAATPVKSVNSGQWKLATSGNVGEFSAVAYYFAQRIYAATGVPQGLISSNWGGSSIEAWMAPAALGRTAASTEQDIVQLVIGAEEKRARVVERLRRWPGSRVQSVEFSSATRDAHNFDPASWDTLQVPGLWEQQGYSGMDGIAWYRREFELSEAELGGGLELGLGRIDDNDTTWVNGHQVGAIDKYDRIRKYRVPADALHKGVNNIVVRVEDSGGGGGIYSGSELLYLQAAGGKRRTLAGTWQFRPEKVSVSKVVNMNHTPTALYNQMLHPLYQTPIKGVLWYQGESNAGSAEQAARYAGQFQKLIHQWRKGWKQATLPFYWVQLASFDSGSNTPSQRPWAILRESQTAALVLPHTGQAITLDIGDAGDIHPRDKKSVGERLARIALRDAYGRVSTHYRGPVLESVTLSGQVLVVHFRTHRGLVTRQRSSDSAGFELVDSRGRVLPVAGKITGNSVVIPLGEGQPIAIRYAWDDNPASAALQDRAGLPAEPFRVQLPAVFDFRAE